jgi:hypothetical protein
MRCGIAVSYRAIFKQRQERDTRRDASLEAARSGSIRLFARSPGGGMAYAGDLKSSIPKRICEFNSRPGHQISNVYAGFRGAVDFWLPLLRCSLCLDFA